MLRITREQEAGGGTYLRLEGRVIGPWVDELARTCAAASGSSRRLVLEMSGVSFLDSEAVRLVRRLVGRGARVLRCSQFVRAQIEGGHNDATTTR